MKMMALEGLEADPAIISSSIERMQNDRLVCQSDVAPFIQHFPMNISLDNFSEEPSEKGLDIALEGMSMLFKVAAGVALVGVLGICIYNFIRSRRAAETIAEGSAVTARLGKLTLELEQDIHTAPGFINTRTPLLGSNEIPHGLGLHFSGEVSYAEFADKFFSAKGVGAIAGISSDLAIKINYGEVPSATDQLMAPMSDYLGDLAKRVTELRKIIADMPGALNAGHIDKITQRIVAIDLKVPRGTVLGLIERNFDNRLPPPRGSFQAGSAAMFEDRVEALANLYTELSEGSHPNQKGGNAEEKATTDWVSTNLSGLIGPLVDISTRCAKVGLSPSLSTGRSIVAECEELKKKVATSDFPDAVDAALKVVLEDVRMDSLAAMKLFDVINTEQRLTAKWVSFVLRWTAEHARVVALFTRSVSPPAAASLTKKAANALKEAQKQKF
jgi:hypothetical protein